MFRLPIVAAAVSLIAATAAAVPGPAAIPTPATPAYLIQVQESLDAWAQYVRDGEPYGELHAPGTPDQYVIVAGRPVQLDYTHCLSAPAAVWWGDGSATC